MLKFNSETKRKHLKILNGSSNKFLFELVLNNESCRSLIPFDGSIRIFFSKEYAIALIEKSRLNKSISMEVEI